ncbi:NBS-LRR type resistance protein [Cucumis melo var. makuwa]|uniref:NBS-LRR type resistance protein n=1 Tax=Cucumis melo var. makuwa TaxID=1194695 RepID=A0A5D3BN68_CUCMM|nr:NBS-LRR type resistance protein [Cucumis melo var. makuwa]
MAFTHPSCPSSVCPSLYPYLKSEREKGLVVPYNAHISLVILKECTYQSSDPEGYTYQSSDPEGYTYLSSDPEGCTYQSSDPEGNTYQ